LLTDPVGITVGENVVGAAVGYLNPWIVSFVNVCTAVEVFVHHLLNAELLKYVGSTDGLGAAVGYLKPWKVSFQKLFHPF
jgi:hypothetical protein